MELEQQVVNALRRLPTDKQREVLDFAEYLLKKSSAGSPPRNIEGIFADAGVRLSAEDIDEARREAWGSFPRDDI